MSIIRYNEAKNTFPILYIHLFIIMIMIFIQKNCIHILQLFYFLGIYFTIILYAVHILKLLNNQLIIE
jgi:hypothetical protein